MKMRMGTKLTALLLATALSIQAASSVFAQTEAEQQPAAASEASGIAQASEDALLDPNLYVGIQEAYQHHIQLRQPDVQPQNIKTIFFTLWQHKLLEEQRRIGVNTHGATQAEIDASGNATASIESRVKDIREISLGGIVYASGEDWVVWLNGQRVTPEAIPKQVIDIQVKADYIELKWYDSWTNLIYPVRLRPHQRFNLDARIFLPGTAAL